MPCGGIFENLKFLWWGETIIPDFSTGDFSTPHFYTGDFYTLPNFHPTNFTLSNFTPYQNYTLFIDYKDHIVWVDFFHFYVFAIKWQGW